MHDDVAGIDQHPIAIGKPFDMRRIKTAFLQAFGDILRNRTDVTIDQIPKGVRDAVVAAEDRDFYTNPGFSFTGLHTPKTFVTDGLDSAIDVTYYQNGGILLTVMRRLMKA